MPRVLSDRWHCLSPFFVHRSLSCPCSFFMAYFGRDVFWSACDHGLLLNEEPIMLDLISRQEQRGKKREGGLRERSVKTSETSGLLMGALRCHR